MLQKRNDLFWTEGIQIWKERDASVIKGHNSDKNRQIKKSWRYVQLHIMGNHPTKYERNPSKGKWLVAYTRIVDGRTDRRTDRVIYVQLHIMGYHPIKYERNPSKGKWLVTYTRIVDGQTDGQSDYYRAPASRCGALIMSFEIVLSMMV